MSLTHSDDTGTVGHGAVRPLHERDALASARVYATVLGWPIAAGHRHRRRAGCTCPAGTSCPVPGAHPRPGPLTPLDPDGLAEAFEQAPGAGIVAPCTPFDAVTLTGPIGTALLLMLDRFAFYAPAVATVYGTVSLLVERGTGPRLTEAFAGLTVHQGPGAWIALPPSYGVRWETPPEPLRPLPHTLAIRPHLERVVTLARRSGDLP
ncbi:hypothetical protein ACFY9C_35310 [Streptomyces filamentosus]|uniref:hypothetical protein n=1 Tax=Streptomyces filamentosus TaxID=67294 RepID=UPI0036F04926